METIIIENVDKRKAELFKQLALEFGLKVKSTIQKKKQIKDSGVITNPEILKRIKEYESGKSKLISFKSVKDLRDYLFENRPNAKTRV